MRIDLVGFDLVRIDLMGVPRECNSTTCKNVATSSHSPHTLFTPTDSYDTRSTGVKDFCSSRSKEELVSLATQSCMHMHVDIK